MSVRQVLKIRAWCATSTPGVHLSHPTTAGAAFLNTFKQLLEEPALLLGVGAI